MPRDGSLSDDEQDLAFAKTVDLARERAKALYIQRVHHDWFNEIPKAFDEGFEAALHLCTGDEFELAEDKRLKGRAGVESRIDVDRHPPAPPCADATVGCERESLNSTDVSAAFAKVSADKKRN